jgi:DNA primase
MKTGFKKFPPEFLQKIREKVNLVDVVGEHVVLRKAGSNFTGLCPFHNERSPSFSVSENKQLYHCYGCKKGGDVFGFVQDIFGISFPEAVAEIAERAQTAMPSDYDAASNEDPEVQKKRAAAREKLQTASKLNRFVAAFYRSQLESTPAADQYFRKRGVFGDTARDFYVGYAPAGSRTRAPTARDTSTSTDRARCFPSSTCAGRSPVSAVARCRRRRARPTPPKARPST